MDALWCEVGLIQEYYFNVSIKWQIFVCLFLLLLEFYDALVRGAWTSTSPSKNCDIYLMEAGWDAENYAASAIKLSPNIFLL